MPPDKNFEVTYLMRVGGVEVKEERFLVEEEEKEVFMRTRITGCINYVP